MAALKTFNIRSQRLLGRSEPKMNACRDSESASRIIYAIAGIRRRLKDGDLRGMTTSIE